MMLFSYLFPLNLSQSIAHLCKPAFIAGCMLCCGVTKDAFCPINELGVLALAVVTDGAKHCEYPDLLPGRYTPGFAEKGAENIDSRDAVLDRCL